MYTLFQSFSQSSRAIIALLIAAIAAVGARADETVLRYNFSPEPLTYRYVMKSDNEITTNSKVLGATVMKSGMKQVALCVFKAKNTTAETSEMDVTYTAMKMRMDNPIGKPIFVDTTALVPKDAAKPSGTPDTDGIMSRSIPAWIGKSIHVTVDTRGQVIKVERTDLFKGMFKDVDSSNAAAVDSIKQMFSDDSIKEMCKDLFVVVPDGAINPGESWTTTLTKSMPMFGDIKRTLNWTYAGDEKVDGRTLAILTATMTMEQLAADPNAKSPIPKIPGMEIEFVSKEAKGTILAKFDAKAGCLRSMSTTMNMPMTMKMTMPAIGNRPSETTTMKTTGKTTVALTLVANDATLDPDTVIEKPDAPVKSK